MTPQAAIDAYRRGLTDRASITRLARGSVDASTATDVHAQIRQYSPELISGSIQQGDQQVLLLKEDLVRQGFPVPPAPGDRVYAGESGNAISVIFCDVNSRRVENETVAYVLQCRG